MMRVIKLRRRRQRRRVHQLRKALRAITHRAITKEEVASRLGLRDHGELLMVLGVVDVLAPRPTTAKIESMGDEALRVWSN